MSDGAGPAGAGPPADDHLLAVVRRATNQPAAEVASWRRCSLLHRVENMTTHALDRVTGELSDGMAWSVVAKTLRPASSSPLFPTIPPEHRPTVLETLDWIDEPRLYRCGLAQRCPDGFRMPTVFDVEEGPGRITIWMEDVADTTPWDLDRYRRTAACLGRLSARWAGDRAIEELSLAQRDIGTMFFGKITNFDLPAQEDDAFWCQPAVADAVDDRYRRDLYRLADLMPGLIAELDALPHGLCHGDATPDNFREPGDGTVVGIDWSYGHVGTLASDLGQLLAGRYESGAGGADQIEATASTIFAGYQDGLAAEGLEVDAALLERSWATHLAIRSVFSALVVDHRSDLDDAGRAHLVRRRAALGRFGLDLALRHATAA